MSLNTVNFLRYRAPHSIIACIGITAAWCFAFSIATDRDFARISETLLALSAIISCRYIYTHNNKSDNLLYFSAFVFFVFMILVNNWAEAAYPDETLNHDRFMRHYIRLFLFLAVGWWLYKNETLATIMFSFLILSFLTKVALDASFLHWDSILSGRRMRFGFSNAQHAGIYAGSILFVTLFLQVKALQTPKVLARICLQILLSSIMAISIVIILSSQTRGIFIGLAAGLPILLVAWGIHSPIAKKLGRKKTIMASCLLIAFSLFFAFQHGSMEKRFTAATKTTSALIKGGINNTPITSSGIRLHQWHLAAQLIMERPLFGHGGATKEKLIRESSMPKAAISNFGHFHNSYLELGVAYGLGATFIFLFLLYFLFQRIIKALRTKQVSPYFGYMSVGWLAFFFTANIFESYIMYQSGYLLFAIIGGAIYGLSMPLKVKR